MARSRSAVAEPEPQPAELGSIETRIHSLEMLVATVLASGARNDQAFYTVQAAKLRIAELQAWTS